MTRALVWLGPMEIGSPRDSLAMLANTLVIVLDGRSGSFRLMKGRH